MSGWVRAELEPETNAVIRNANDAQSVRSSSSSQSGTRERILNERHVSWEGVAGHGALQGPKKQREAS